MTDKHTLVERLLNGTIALNGAYLLDSDTVCGWLSCGDVRLAATRITALEAEMAELVGALEGICSQFTHAGVDGWFDDPIHEDEVSKARATLTKARQSEGAPQP